MIKSSFEAKVEQMKEFFHQNKDEVLNYEVTSGWVSRKRPVKVLEIRDAYVRVGIVNSKGDVLYPENINYAAMIEGNDNIIDGLNMQEELCV